MKYPEYYYNEYSKKNIIPQWFIPNDFSDAKEVAYRDLLGEYLKSIEPNEIVEYYAYTSFKEMENKIEYINKFVNINGIGIELGAGCGLFSSVLAKSSNIKYLLAIEVVSSMTNEIIPKVSKYYLEEHNSKVVPVVGSFDDLEIPDESVDFAIEYDSLHHSHNLSKTFNEISRVLKPRGKIIIVDRCQPNALSDEEVDIMLNREYGKEWLRHNYYPEDEVLTRRENGEHEYRLKEWEQAISNANMKIILIERMHKKVSLKGVLINSIRVLKHYLFGRNYGKKWSPFRDFQVFFTQLTGRKIKDSDGFLISPFMVQAIHTFMVVEKID